MTKTPAPTPLRAPLLLAAVAASFLTAGIAFADAPRDSAKEQRQAREATAIRSAVERGELLSLPRILSLAQGHVRGEVIKVELEQDHGHLGYEVKILADNGRVREVKLDARSGALIEIEDD